MAETIDLTGDGGVLKTIVKRAKPEAIGPCDNLPLVDGIQPKLIKQIGLGSLVYI